jgi:outer membrane lipoprotein
MKKYYLLIALAFSLMSSCVPVISRNLLSQGILDTNLSEIKQDPASYKGRLFILGGIIVKTSTTKDGSLIEAVFVPVDSWGYLKSFKASSGRFLAIYKSGEILDPLIYSEKREITLAGEFIELRKGKIGEMEYTYPLFEIKEIHLWEEVKDMDYYYYYSPPPPYPYWYYRHRPYDPWWWYY